MSRFYFKQYQIAEEPKTKEEKPRIEEVEDSIELADVHRTRKYTDGTMIVLLKDGHEVTKEIKVMSNKGVPTSRNERVWVQSEIRLTPDDAIRFKKLTEEYDWTKVEDANKEFGEGLGGEISGMEVEPLTSKQLELDTEIVPNFVNSEITTSIEEAEQEATRDKAENN